jgi:DNA-binding GntR family transcriptional regulator
MPEIERPRSLTAIVTEHVRDMVVNGDVPLGSALSERSIAAELKVSKTPVREALAQLRNEGLVSIVPQSGVRVFTLSAREVREICKFRRTLELAAVELAMEGTPQALERDLAAIVKRMHAVMKAGNQREYLRLDTQFHLTFFEHCGNSYLQNAYGLYSGKIAALRTHLAHKPKHTALSLQEHEEIVAAVAARDFAMLADVLNRHIARTQETYEISIEDIARADRTA